MKEKDRGRQHPAAALPVAAGPWLRSPAPVTLLHLRAGMGLTVNDTSSACNIVKYLS